MSVWNIFHPDTHISFPAASFPDYLNQSTHWRDLVIYNHFVENMGLSKKSIAQMFHSSHTRWVHHAQRIAQSVLLWLLLE